MLTRSADDVATIIHLILLSLFGEVFGSSDGADTNAAAVDSGRSTEVDGPNAMVAVVTAALSSLGLDPQFAERAMEVPCNRSSISVLRCSAFFDIL